MTATARIPCRGCTVCCETDAIYLHRGDDVASYETTVYHGRLILAHSKAHGGCIYLEPGVGCSIHDRRPTVCRELDCSKLLDLPPEVIERALERGAITERFLEAARALKARKTAKVTPRVPGRRHRRAVGR